MVVTSWSDKFKVGIDKIDSDHRNLVDLLNKLQKSYDTCLDRNETELIFDELEKYASDHFSFEEKLMIENSYPFLSGHVRDHVYFAEMIRKWRNDEEIDCKSKKLSIFLTEWLFEHILHHDFKLGEHLSKS